MPLAGEERACRAAAAATHETWTNTTVIPNNVAIPGCRHLSRATSRHPSGAGTNHGPPPGTRAPGIRCPRCVHPLTGRPAPAADVLADLVDAVRPALADAGGEQTVADGVQDLLRRGTGAELQRRVHRETGDLTAVVRAAVAVTNGEDAARATVGATG
jgi:hypothetical protein